MNNRKARALLTGCNDNGYPRQWVRITNTRIALYYRGEFRFAVRNSERGNFYDF